MSDKEESVWDERFLGIKLKNFIGGLSLIIGSALTVMGVTLGLEEGFSGNYIKLFAGVFLMIMPIDMANRFARETIRKNKEKESLKKEIERVFDTPEKKIDAPAEAKQEVWTPLVQFYCFLLLLSVYLIFVSIGTIIAGLVLDSGYSCDYGDVVMRIGAGTLLGSMGLFVLSIYLLVRDSK